MNLLRTHDHNIGNLRLTITSDIVLKAEFQEKIALMRRNISDHDCLMLQNFLLDAVNTCIQGNLS